MILRSSRPVRLTLPRRLGATALLVLLLACAAAAALASTHAAAAAPSPSPAVALARAQLDLQAAQAAAQAVESDEALTDTFMQQMRAEANAAPVAAAAAAAPAAVPVVVAALARPVVAASIPPPTPRRSAVPAAPAAVPASVPAAAPISPSAPAEPSPTLVVEMPDEPDLGEAGGNVESALPRDALLRSMQQPGVAASTLPASLTTRAASHMISDTYEAELQEQQEAARINNAELRELDQELEERVDPECPLDGTFQQLRRFGHRLWYEGDITLARVCMDKAVNLYLSPTNSVDLSSISTSPVASPTDDPKYRTVLLESSHLPERTFEDFGHVIEMVQRRTERLYSMPWSPVRPRLHEKMKREGSLFWQPPHVEQMANAHAHQTQRRAAGKQNKGVQRKQKQGAVKKATVPRKAVANANKSQAKPSPAPATAAIPAQPVAAAATRKSL